MGAWMMVAEMKMKISLLAVTDEDHASPRCYYYIGIFFYYYIPPNPLSKTKQSTAHTRKQFIMQRIQILIPPLLDVCGALNASLHKQQRLGLTCKAMWGSGEKKKQQLLSSYERF